MADDIDAEGLAALKARVAGNKANRLQAKEALDAVDDAPSNSPVKSVAFSDVVNQQTIPSRETEQISQGPASKGKEKTKAKQRYLKRKAERRKASKKQSQASTESVAEVEGADQLSQKADVNESPDQRKARKRALKEARRSQNGTEPVAVSSEVQSAQELASKNEETTERPRKKRRLSEETAAEVETSPEKQQKSLKSVKAIEKANRALRKAQRRAEREAKAKADGDLEENEETEGSNVVHLDALPRFQRPAKAAKADEGLLYELSISEELRSGKSVRTDLTIPVVDFQETVEGRDIHYLSERMQKRLAKQGITSLFSVQCTVLPMLLGQRARSRRSLRFPLRDLYVNAPTGSGKTLAYVLPLAELLHDTPVRRLRAVIVLPTRDLALQIKEVFDYFCINSSVKVGLACGQQSFAKEQSLLQADQFGISEIDILIGTPGRILDHLAETQGFTLKHLEYFIIDEADRLLNQSFNDWLPTLLDALSDSATEGEAFSQSDSRFDQQQWSRLQKLLFSATLTRDAVQTNALRLSSPYYIAVRSSVDVVETQSSSIALPSTLKEYFTVVKSGIKPMVLAHLLRKFTVTQALCFTHSTQSAHRLVRLLDLLAKEKDVQIAKAVSFSSDLSVGERTRILEDFRSGKISLLVCSDLIARGMDIEQVTHVFNYDSPMDMVKYVHRVGRTARAGRSGEAWTLVEPQEANPFKAMLSRANHLDALKKAKVTEKDLDPLLHAYERALEALKAEATGS